MSSASDETASRDRLAVLPPELMDLIIDAIEPTEKNRDVHADWHVHCDAQLLYYRALQAMRVLNKTWSTWIEQRFVATFFSEVRVVPYDVVSMQRALMIFTTSHLRRGVRKISVCPDVPETIEIRDVFDRSFHTVCQNMETCGGRLGALQRQRDAFIFMRGPERGLSELFRLAATSSQDFQLDISKWNSGTQRFLCRGNSLDMPQEGYDMTTCELALKAMPPTGLKLNSLSLESHTLEELAQLCKDKTALEHLGELTCLEIELCFDDEHEGNEDEGEENTAAALDISALQALFCKLSPSLRKLVLESSSPLSDIYSSTGKAINVIIETVKLDGLEECRIKNIAITTETYLTFLRKHAARLEADQKLDRATSSLHCHWIVQHGTGKDLEEIEVQRFKDDVLQEMVREGVSPECVETLLANIKFE